MVLPRRHVLALADLTPAEADELGPLLVNLSAALRHVTGCVKTYVMQFAEAEGFAHAHIHVVPRAADLPADLRGPAVFSFLGRPESDRVTEDEQDRIAEAVGRELERHLPER